MKRNGRLFAGLIIVLLVMLSTACAANNTELNKNSNAAGNSGKTNAGVSDKMRVITSLKGDISIPTEPQRVIGLSVVYPEFLYALGVTPIAVQNYHQDFPSYLKEPFKDTMKMGIAQTPDFEAILASEPDLIIAPTWWSDKDYDQLSKIAPTVLLPQRDNWRDELRDIGEVLGKKDQAEKVIQDLEAEKEEAKKKLDTLVGDETVMYMMIMAKEIVIYGENIDRGTFIHKELGLKPIKEFPQNEPSLSISLEKIPEYNPDHIILQLDDETSEEVQSRYKQMLDSSLWKNMTAVKENQVYIMGGKEWFSLGMSPLADSHAIDEVVHAFENKQK
ncbi:ABC transporter substrate-binding protein [Paenibacillus sp. LHD-38]|uniref:ABC transporter substrate-binding protein n=1 Tax=Paenibacillus sp. LHD-38 TaxID=3072143 RepID=UPI00280DD657|nr:ABC transporter substrate-binding protein [Paenibacillus sp. LHD-38]MDQ8734296.1 ABC transporter substrate-binding protein [Paenibacillus sp. LHD-38]